MLVALLMFSPMTTFRVNAEDVFNDVQSTNISSDPSIRTNLEDNYITKADRLTFDLWAYDSNGNKISASNVKVTNNGKKININWDDTEKTSYTLNLNIGINNVEIVVENQGKTYTNKYKLTREEAKDGDVIGTFIFSLDAFTIGLGYIIEPVEVDIIKGRRASHELDEILKKNGFDYRKTGQLDNSFYFATLLDDTNVVYKTEPNIPDILKEKLEGNYDEGNYDPEWGLGEFDFNSLSGWMYSVNNIFPNVGFADYYLKDGDVMRVQYTIALGSDIGGGWGSNFFDKVNKDALTKKIAQINSSDKKDEYLKNDNLKKVYNHAINVLKTVDASQVEIDEALEKIDQEENIVVAKKAEEKIADLPEVSNLTLKDKALVEEVRVAYNQLTESQQKLVANAEKLSQLEARIKELEQEAVDKAAAKKAEEKIADLPEVSNLTLKDKALVEEVRVAYNQLTESQQKLVANEEKLSQLEARIKELEQEAVDKAAAKKAEEKIADLPEVSNLTLGNKALVEEVRVAYNQLTESQQKLVANEEKLSQLEARIKELEQEAVDKAAAKKAEEKIADLPEVSNLTLKDKALVEEVRVAYNQLTESQQKLVANEEKLSQLEARIKELEQEAVDKAAAKKAEEKIADLPEVSNLTLGNKALVEEVRVAYNQLTESQQKLVANEEKLSQLEARIKELEQEAVDKAAAKKAEEKIADLPEVSNLTLKDKALVEEVRVAYNQLTESQQKLVANEEKLSQLEARIKELEQEAVDKAAAKKAEEKIADLPEVSNLTLGNKALVEEVRVAYNQLTESQQKLVANEEKLSQLEARIKELEQEAVDKAAAKKAEEKIADLPEVSNLTLGNKALVEEVRVAYNQLTESQQKLVANEEKLSQLEARIKELEQEVVDKALKEVEEKIADLPEVSNLTLEDKALVEEVRVAYNQLTESQQKLVANEEKLSQLEARIKELEQEAVAKKAEEKIADLPEVSNLTLKDKALVEEVRVAYNQLTESQQKLVANAEKLSQLEAKLKELEQYSNDNETVPSDSQQEGILKFNYIYQLSSEKDYSSFTNPEIRIELPNNFEIESIRATDSEGKELNAKLVDGKSGQYIAVNQKEIIDQFKATYQVKTENNEEMKTNDVQVINSPNDTLNKIEKEKTVVKASIQENVEINIEMKLNNTIPEGTYELKTALYKSYDIDAEQVDGTTQILLANVNKKEESSSPKTENNEPTQEQTNEQMQNQTQESTQGVSNKPIEESSKESIDKLENGNPTSDTLQQETLEKVSEKNSVKNNNVEIPKTGENQSVVSFIVGISFILIGFLLLIRKKLKLKL